MNSNLRSFFPGPCARRSRSRAWRKAAGFVVLLAVTIASSIAAASSRKALVIGNNTYTNVAKLKNARADAEAMDKTLRELGFTVDLKLDLNERALRTAVRGFIGSLDGGDEAVVYYAGHGVQIGAANYLLPVDIKPVDEAQIQDESLALQRVLDDLTAQRVRFSVVIVDACRDNPLPRVAGRSLGGTRGLAATSPATGQMVIFSAGAGQSALDSLGPTDRSRNGVFTRVLLERIRDPGVPVDQVLRNVREEVVEMARSVGHQQVPALYDQVIGRFYFNPSEAAVAAAKPAASASAVTGATPPASPAAPVKPAESKASNSGDTAAGLVALLGVAGAIAALSNSNRDKKRGRDTGSQAADSSTPATDSGPADRSSASGDFDFQVAQATACPDDPQEFWSNCTGTLRYDSGDSYEGMWFKNTRHGFGTYRFASGSIYSGQYRENQYSGQGTYYWADSGARYVGEFREGNFNGRGIVYSRSGDLQKSGEWRSDELVNEFAIDPAEFPADSHLTLP